MTYPATPSAANREPSQELTAQDLTEVFDPLLTDNLLAHVSVGEDGTITRELPGERGSGRLLKSITSLDGVTAYSLFNGYNFIDKSTTEYKWSNDPTQTEATLERLGPDNEKRPMTSHEIFEATTTALLYFDQRRPRPTRQTKVLSYLAKVGILPLGS